MVKIKRVSRCSGTFTLVDEVVVLGVTSTTQEMRVSAAVLIEGESVTLSLANVEEWSDGLRQDGQRPTSGCVLQKRSTGAAAWVNVPGGSGCTMTVKPTETADWRCLYKGGPLDSRFIDVAVPAGKWRLGVTQASRTSVWNGQALRLTAAATVQYTDGKWRPIPAEQPFSVCTRVSGRTSCTPGFRSSQGLLEALIYPRSTGNYWIQTGTEHKSKAVAITVRR